MTVEQRRAEYVTLLAALLQGKTPTELPNMESIDNLFNIVTAIQKKLDGRNWKLA